MRQSPISGQVSTITAPGSKVWTYAYNALGQPTSVAIPNGMTTEYGYDGRNRLTKIEHKDGATVLDGFTYALDDGGNITPCRLGLPRPNGNCPCRLGRPRPNGNCRQDGLSVPGQTSKRHGMTTEYGYDTRNRLTAIEHKDGATVLDGFTYALDAGGNLLTKAVCDGTNTTAFGVNNANEMTSRTIGGTTTTYAYDALGRMTSGTDGTYTATFAYGPAGMLSTFTSDFPTQSNATYVTGGDGKRRSRTVGGTETWYNWAGMSVINEENSAGVLTRTYFGHTAAHVDGTSPATGDYEYYFHDHLGSARHVRNQDKSSFAEFEYDPYGTAYASSGSTSSVSHQYAMLDWDDAPRLYFAPYRYYGPAGGRWLTRDPLGMVDGPNLYGYVGANPIGSIDPLGRTLRDMAGHGSDLALNTPEYYDKMDCVGDCIRVNGCDDGLLKRLSDFTGLSAPVWPVIPKELLIKLGYDVTLGGSDWTTWLSFNFRVHRPQVYGMSLSGLPHRMMNWLSKTGSYLTILDGTLAWGKILKCVIYCSYGMEFRGGAGGRVGG